MNALELREQYQHFFEQRGHRRIPSAPLLPENDPSVLFTTAGMQPLAPYLLGEFHPMGARLTNVQRCLRTNDIDEVGDRVHLTFFEMLGNWSLGDYYKAESLAWSFEFLTRELSIPQGRLAVTVFAGDASAPRDDESASIWQRLGLPGERIYYLPKEDNWWGPVGSQGPCGPDSEIFFDSGLPEHPGCHPGCPCGKWVEIWNNVFMEYQQVDGGRLVKLEQRNVDTGMGVERMLAVLNGYQDLYEVDTLAPLVARLEALSGRSYSSAIHPIRVVADHIRAATLAVADGAAPSNVEAGYVVRRLIRRAVRYGQELGISGNFVADLGGVALNIFSGLYPELGERQTGTLSSLEGEEIRFKETLDRGLREVGRVVQEVLSRGEKTISGETAFHLYETYGFPLAFTMELAREHGLAVDEPGFDVQLEAHKALSRRHTEGKFKGGLADQAEQTTRLHTATHLLHAALRQIMGTEVRQMGSNITAERLRFDFTAPRKLTPEELQQVENLVNIQVEQDLPVTWEILPREAALSAGALAFFGEKYGDQVKVYTIGDFSKEVCGGPHVTHTGELGRFKITKEEAVGRGVRRVRGVLETG